jgi:hypothetical protein
VSVEELHVLQCINHPPVLVPPIISKYSQGFGGVRGLSALMILERLMEAVDPSAPPSRASRRSSLPGIVGRGG